MEALKISNSIQDTTLGVYAFGTKEESKKGVCFNVNLHHFDFMVLTKDDL